MAIAPELTALSADGRVPISLEITSDPLCPFCYIGFKKIDKAVEAARAEGMQVTIRYLPYQLDPTLPEDVALNRREFMENKLGDRLQEFECRTLAQGEAVGIKFERQRDGTVRSTMQAQRLIAHAYQLGGEPLQHLFIKTLFSGYHEHALDLGCRTFLSYIATSVGLFPSVHDAQTWLDGDEMREEVKEGCERARKAGIKGVPFVRINGRFGMCGAQEPGKILEHFKKIASGQFQVPNMAPGPACTV